MNDPATLLEAALVAYLAPYLADATSGLHGFTAYVGHRDAKIDQIDRYLVITATNLGGPLAHAGNYDCAVQFKIVTQSDDAGMAVHAPAVLAILSIFGRHRMTTVVDALNAASATLGVSCFELLREPGTQEARDPDRREHGTIQPATFCVHLKAAA